MKELDLTQLTPEQLDELSKRVMSEKREKEARIRNERQTYKSLVNDLVNESIPKIMKLSDEIASIKKDIYDTFDTAIKMKQELYSVSAGKYSNTFSNVDQTFRLTLGYRTIDEYDNTVNEGIEMVKGYLNDLVGDDKTKTLVDLVIRLLARDQKGNLKPSRVMQLAKMAEESGNEQFIDGMQIIRNAYQPTTSKTFVRAERKLENGAWVSVPLSTTEA